MAKSIKISELQVSSDGFSRFGAVIKDVQVRYGECNIIWDLNQITNVSDEIQLFKGSSIVSDSSFKPVINLIEDGQFALNSDTCIRGLKIQKNESREMNKPILSYAVKVEGDNVRVSEVDVEGNSNYGVLVVGAIGFEMEKVSIRSFKIAGLTIRDSSFHIENVSARFCGHGVHFLGSQGDAVDCICEQNTKHGFTVVHCSKPILIRNCLSKGNQRHGCVFGGSSRERPSNRDWRIMQCTAISNSKNGISVDPTVKDSDKAIYQNGFIEKCISLENKKHGIFVTHAHNVSITQCASRGNDIAGIAFSKSRDITVNLSAVSNNRKADVAFYGGAVKNTGAYIFKNNIGRLTDENIFFNIKPPLGYFIEN